MKLTQDRVIGEKRTSIQKMLPSDLPVEDSVSMGSVTSWQMVLGYIRKQAEKVTGSN